MQQQQPHSSNISRPITQYAATYLPSSVVLDQHSNKAQPFSSITHASFQQAATTVTAEHNARPLTSNLVSGASQVPLGYPYPVSSALPPLRPQIQNHHSYHPSMDARYLPRTPVHPVQVGASAPSGSGPSTPAGMNAPSHAPSHVPSHQPHNLSTPTHSTQPDTFRPPTAPISAPPPEVAPLFHPAVDVQAIQQKMEGTLSQVGINLGAIWRHIVDTTTLEAAKHRSETLRWKERCLHFEEMYKTCKRRLDSMNHDNMMLQTQISLLKAELTHARGQGRPIGPSPQVLRPHVPLPSKGQDHVAYERARTVSSVHPTPASAVELSPSSSRMKETSGTPSRKMLVVDLSGDGEDVEIVPKKIAQNETPSALCTTEEPRPAILPATTVRLPAPSEQPTTASSPELSSPEVSTHVTTSPRFSRVTSPLAAHGISGFLSSKPSSGIRTVTPVKPRNNVNNSTIRITPMLGTPQPTDVSLVQTTKPATSSSMNGPEEELEEGELKSVSPLASPVDSEAVQDRQLPLQSQVAARAEPVKNARSHSDSVPPLSLYFKPNQSIPLISKNIPKKRPLESGEEGPVKKARPVLPLNATRLPQRQTGIGSRSTTTASSRPGTAERASTQSSEGISKPEPNSPVLSPNTPTSSRLISTDITASTAGLVYEATAVTAPDPPPEYVISQKQELTSLITRELRRQADVIYCYPCICEFERNPSKLVTRFTRQQSIFLHVLHHFESQHTEWWEKVQSDASNLSSA